MNPIFQGNIEILEQGINLLTNISDDIYTRQDEFVNSTIGQHVRHILDMFAILQSQFNKQEVIDYETRERNTPVETDKKIALQRYAQYKTWINSLKEQDLNTQVSILHETTPSKTQCVEQCSFFGRELIHICSHAIHHYAIIKLSLKHFGEPISQNDNFGIAASTITSNRQSA